MEPLVDVVAEFGTVVGESVGKQYNIDNARAERFLRQYMAERVDLINATTRRALHKALDGDDPEAAVRQVFERAREVRARQIAETECLPGDASVSSAVVRTAFRRWYDGDMVEVITEHGRKFSATPNHPMLTRRGWVVMQDLTEFDDLICDARQKDLVSHMDIDHGPTSISEVFDALAAVGVTDRKPTTGPDFHGDGRQGQVDIASADRELRVGLFSPILKPLSEQLFAPTDRARAPLCGKCRRLLAVNHRAGGFCSPDLLPGLFQAFDHGAWMQSIFLGHLRSWHLLVIISKSLSVNVHPIIRRMPTSSIEETPSAGASARRNAGSFESLVNETVISPYDQCYLGSAKPSEIEFDRVATKRVFRFVGHVFNLHTPFGYFAIAQGVYTGNTVRASNWAALDAGKWVGSLRFKRWATQQDGQVRHDHVEMHNQTRAWNDDFEAPNGSKAQWPGGFPEPELSVNCRCAALPSRAGQRDRLAEYGDAVDLYDNVRAPHVDALAAAWREVFREQERAVIEELLG